ncbi:MAG TPA: hypothetical protein VF787_00665 [Thermoanaerobaculia bacterium]
MKLSICLFSILSFCVSAQETAEPALVQPATGEAQNAGPDFFALLDKDMPSSYDWLQATVSIEDKAAGVSCAPFLATKTYNEFFSETRFQVGQKDGKSNLGVTFRWNPVSPRSARGIKKWAEVSEDFTIFGESTRRLRTLRRELIVTQDAEFDHQIEGISKARELVEDLDRRIGESTSEAEQAALGKELKEASKQLASMRLDARLAQSARIREQLVKEREQLAEVHTELAKIVNVIKGINTNVENEKALAKIVGTIETLLATLADADEVTTHALLTPSQLALLDAEISAIEKSLAKQYAAAVADYETALYEKPLPIISLTYGGTLFTGLGGNFVDSDGDGLDDNALVLAGRALTLSGQLRFGPAQQLTFGAGRSWKWAAAEEGTAANKADTYGLSYSRRLVILNKKYKETEEYLSNLFVPSVVGGLAAEYSGCRTELAQCESKAESIFALTPFVDVKVKKAAQFRVGLTWKKFSGSDLAEGDELGVVTLISVQLGMPN